MLVTFEMISENLNISYRVFGKKEGNDRNNIVFAAYHGHDIYAVRPFVGYNYQWK